MHGGLAHRVRPCSVQIHTTVPSSRVQSYRKTSMPFAVSHELTSGHGKCGLSAIRRSFAICVTTCQSSPPPAFGLALPANTARTIFRVPDQPQHALDHGVEQAGSIHPIGGGVHHPGMAANQRARWHEQRHRHAANHMWERQRVAAVHLIHRPVQRRQCQPWRALPTTQMLAPVPIACSRWRDVGDAHQMIGQPCGTPDHWRLSIRPLGVYTLRQ